MRLGWYVEYECGEANGERSDGGSWIRIFE